MPEIAEVAITAEILEHYFRNKILISFEFVSGRYTKKHPDGYPEFIVDLPLKIRKVDSRGKFLWMEFSKPSTKNIVWYCWNTFGLSGMWSVKETKHTRAIMHFKGGKKAYFSDMRNFGTFKFSTDHQALARKIEDLSPDLLKDSDIDLSAIHKYRNTPIVKLLMDQKKVGSGIGNYLVAEILYRAKISPHRKAGTLSTEELKRLAHWIKYMIKLSYMNNHIGYMTGLEEEAQKIPRKNYHPEIKLRDKTFKFLVYKQKKDPYGNPVKVDKIVGSGPTARSTYWVPAVQL